MSLFIQNVLFFIFIFGQHIVGLQALIDRYATLWPGRIIYYNVAPELPPNMRRAVMYSIEYLSSVSCVKWIQRLPWFYLARNYVSFQYYYHEGDDDITCQSDVGMVGGQQVIDLGPRCMAGPDDKIRYQSVLHEMMHTMGFHHEHQRPNRYCYVAIDPPEYAFLHTEYKILQPPQYFSDWPYDYESIMHYTESFHLYPHDHTKHLYRTDGKISKGDIERIEYLYCDKPSYCDSPGGNQKCDEIRRQESENEHCRT